MRSAAIYARVSSERQAQQATVASQLAELHQRAQKDEVRILDADVFVDNGYSGTTLVRPALERLRDGVAFGVFDTIYVHSPDRLARKYAYQVLLIDEFKARGVALVFVHGRQGTSPEDELLVQVQGVIAEYERTRMLERCRRGRLFKARSGLVNVLTCAPFGYRYVARTTTQPARLEVLPDEAAVVQSVFAWVVIDQLSLGAIGRRLEEQGVAPRSGNPVWSRSTVHGMLRNSCYIGEARFGKREAVAPQPRARQPKGYRGAPRVAHSSSRTRPIEEQIVIPVPAIVEREVFDEVQEQLSRNRALSNRHATQGRYLLQGVLGCAGCGTAFAGQSTSYARKDGSTTAHRYYGCNARKTRSGACTVAAVRADEIEADVWEAVQSVLMNPARVLDEWARRTEADGSITGLRNAQAAAERVVAQLELTDQRLLDAYEAGVVDLPELKARREPLHARLAQARAALEHADRQLRGTVELREVITTVERFRDELALGIQNLTWERKQQVIRALVRQVAISANGVHITFRVPGSDAPTPPSPPAVDDSEDRSSGLCTRRLLPRAGEGEALRPAPSSRTGQLP